MHAGPADARPTAMPQEDQRQQQHRLQDEAEESDLAGRHRLGSQLGERVQDRQQEHAAGHDEHSFRRLRSERRTGNRRGPFHPFHPLLGPREVQTRGERPLDADDTGTSPNPGAQVLSRDFHARLSGSDVAGKAGMSPTAAPGKQPEGAMSNRGRFVIG